MSKPAIIDHARFIQMLTEEFPEVVASFDEYAEGLIHVQMGTFARITEQAIDGGNLWQAEKYFRFVARARENASPEVENAIDVSYLEWLAFSDCTENRLRAIKERMPKSLRTIVLEIDGRGRWQ